MAICKKCGKLFKRETRFQQVCKNCSIKARNNRVLTLILHNIEKRRSK